MTFAGTVARARVINSRPTTRPGLALRDAAKKRAGSRFAPTARPSNLA
jgi:hypothetical protein